MSKRLSYIDIAKGIAMIFIVFGHTIIHTPNAYSIYQYIYSFHVVLFFILSGFTYSNKRGLKEFIFVKFKKLMTPFFIFATLFLIPYFLLAHYTSFNIEIADISEIKSLLLEIIYGNGNNLALKQNTSLWFLPALFSSEVIYRCLDKVNIKYKDIFLTLLLLVVSYISTYMQIVLPWGINTALALLVFFQLGILIKKYEVIEKINRSLIIKIVLIILSVSTIYIYSKNKTVDCANYSYGVYGIFLFTSLVLPLLIIWVSKVINKCKLLEYIGKNTLSILIFHKLFVILFQLNYSFMPSFLKNENLWISMPTAVIVTAISITISLGIGYIINKYFPFLYGNNYKKSLKEVV